MLDTAAAPLHGLVQRWNVHVASDCSYELIVLCVQKIAAVWLPQLQLYHSHSKLYYYHRTL